jgi:dTDP-4-amino-4,6-dideoxygalactose transaminase
LDGLQGAVLNTKLKHLEDWTEKRRRNAYLYNELLNNLPLVTPVEIESVRSVYHLYVIRLKAEFRQKFQDHLKKNGIVTGIHYPIALPYLKAYDYLGYGPGDFPEALRASQEIVSLPMYPELPEQQIKFIAENINEFFQKAKI